VVGAHDFDVSMASLIKFAALANGTLEMEPDDYMTSPERFDALTGGTVN
jgi:hypothetical protein